MVNNTIASIVTILHVKEVRGTNIWPHANIPMLLMLYLMLQMLLKNMLKNRLYPNVTHVGNVTNILVASTDTKKYAQNMLFF